MTDNNWHSFDEVPERTFDDIVYTPVISMQTTFHGGMLEERSQLVTVSIMHYYHEDFYLTNMERPFKKKGWHDPDPMWDQMPTSKEDSMWHYIPVEFTHN